MAQQQARPSLGRLPDVRFHRPHEPSIFTGQPGTQVDIIDIANKPVDLIAATSLVCRANGLQEVTELHLKQLLDSLKTASSVSHLRLELPDGEGFPFFRIGACIVTVASFKQLIDLALHTPGRNIGEDECRQLVECLPRSLRGLSLNFACDFSGSGDACGLNILCAGLPLDLQELQLNLKRWFLGDLGAEMLGNRLSRLSNLVRLSLNLANSDIQIEGLLKLNVLKKSPNLIGLCLNLQECGLDTREAMDALAEMLPTSTDARLQECHVLVGGNQMGGDACVKVLQRIASHAGTLKDLGVALPNELIAADGEFISSLVRLLDACNGLKILKIDLEGCFIGRPSERIFQALPQSLQSLILNMRQCEVPLFLHALPTQLSRLTNLQNLELNLSDNYLKDEHLYILAECLKHVRKLTRVVVNLKDNSGATAAGLRAIHAAARTLSDLQTIQVEVDHDAAHHGSWLKPGEPGHLEELQHAFTLKGYVEKAEQRAITVNQLRQVVEYSRANCCHWNGLTMSSLNLYHLCEWLIAPATWSHNCSLMELLAAKTQTPNWFVTHWWGERINDFLRCIEAHMTTRGFDPECAYWICAYANRQHDLGRDISADPMKSSFFRAMQLSKGILVVLNAQQDDSAPAVAFKRVWCAFEISVVTDQSLQGQRTTPLLLDVAAASGQDADARILTDGLTTDEQELDEGLPGSGMESKALREKSFPIEVFGPALRLRIEHAQASQEADRVHILNCLARRDLESRPALDQHERYTHINKRLRAQFAVAGWRQAVEKHMVEELGLPDALLGDIWRKQLDLDFSSCSEMGDEAMQALAGGLPSGLQDLTVNFYDCTRIGNSGLGGLGARFPAKLQTLDLNFTNCCEIDKDGIHALFRMLPHTIRKLSVTLYGVTKVDDAVVRSLADKIPSSLKELLLDFEYCDRITDSGLASLGKALPSSLEFLQLSFRDCSQITDAGVSHIAKGLPSVLVTLSLSFRRSSLLTDNGLETLANSLPATLQKLRLNFRRCEQIGNKGVKALARRLPRRLEGLLLSFHFCAKVGDAAALALAEHFPQSIATLRLNLRETAVGDAGMQALVDRLPRAIQDLQFECALDEVLTLPMVRAWLLQDSEAPAPPPPAPCQENHRIRAPTREVVAEARSAPHQPLVCGGGGDVRIICRLRPMSSKEKFQGDLKKVTAIDDKSVVVESASNSERFTFDRAYEPGTQDDVFSECQNLLHGLLEGQNSAVVAYGQTGAGKTFTMGGTPDCPGICARVGSEIFKAAAAGLDVQVYISVLELYRQDFVDLLSTAIHGRHRGNRVQLLSNGLPDVMERECSDSDEISDAIEVGISARKVMATAMNSESSRSHLIILLRASTRTSTGERQEGHMALVDLAGSERLSKSQVTGDGAKEAVEINKSLTALGDVLSAKSQQSRQIPYRNHKLTMLLQKFIGGTGKALMFVNVSPSSSNINETLYSFKYASRACAGTSLGQSQSFPISGNYTLPVSQEPSGRHERNREGLASVAVEASPTSGAASSSLSLGAASQRVQQRRSHSTPQSSGTRNSSSSTSLLASEEPQPPRRSIKVAAAKQIRRAASSTSAMQRQFAPLPRRPQARRSTRASSD